MDCVVLSSGLCCDDGQTTAVDTCYCHGEFAAFATQNRLFVYYLPNTELPLLELHSTFLRPAAALAIQKGQLGTRSLALEQDQNLLAAATPHGLLLWVLEDAYAAVADQQTPPAPLCLANDTATGNSEAVALNNAGLAAVGCNSSILIWNLHQLEVVYRLQGHQGVVTALSFTPDSPSHLISAAGDRTFNIWDLAEGQLLYQSSILGAAVPSCIAVEAQRLVLGCQDGSIRQFDLSLLPTCRELQVLDVSKQMQQVAAAAVAAALAAAPKQPSGPRIITAATGSGIPTLQQQLLQLTVCTTTAAQRAQDSCEQCSTICLSAAAEGSGCILSMQFVQRSRLLGGGSSSSGGDRGGGSMYSRQLLDELLKPAPQLLVCTRRGLLLVDLSSGDVEQCYLFGREAGQVLNIIDNKTAQDAGSTNSRRSSEAFNKQPVPVNKLQQPCEQQLQQQQRWFSCFRALPEVEQPAAACCFAWQQQEQAEAAQLVCCIASGFSSRVSVLQLAAARRTATWGRSTAVGQPAAAAAAADYDDGNAYSKALSVFQTKPLPADSPLLARGLTRTLSKTGVAARTQKVAYSKTPTQPQISSSSTAASRSNPTQACSSSSSGRARWSQTTTSSTTVSPNCRPTPPVQHSSSSKSVSPSVSNKLGKHGSKGSLAEQPVTFHKKIKSSGYGFVQPKVKLGQSKPAPVKVGLQGSKGPQRLTHLFAEQRQYPLGSGPPVNLLPETFPADAPAHGGGITRVEFAADGCRLLTGSTDKTARCLWLPVAKYGGAGTTFVGHNGPINSISWSHDGGKLLTASADRTACLWSSSLPSPLLTFDSAEPAAENTNSLHRSSSSSSSNNRTGCSTTRGVHIVAGSREVSVTGTGGGSGSSSSSSGQGFLGEVTAARFFYMDEVVVLATGNKVLMCRYKLADAPADDDIQRLKSTGSCSLAAAYSSSCQGILDVAAANSFLSTLLLLACSNRSIELVDASTMQVACTIPDAHARPVQRLVQPAASPFVSHAREIHELFASTAPDGLVKLWDVRSGSCVRSFTGHKNSSSQVPIGAAFSPCMRYLATGSEDKAACIYDLRRTTLLHKLRPPAPADVVADVAFHPYKPQLVVGCMNGRLHWYGDVCSREQQHSLPGGGIVERQVVDEFV